MIRYILWSCFTIPVNLHIFINIVPLVWMNVWCYMMQYISMIQISYVDNGTLEPISYIQNWHHGFFTQILSGHFISLINSVKIINNMYHGFALPYVS